MSKHTPGKWTHDSAEALHIRAEDGGLIATLVWSNGRHFSNGRRTAEQVMANARLLASAPDLLQQCISALAAWEGTGPGILLDDLRAAIAKATGEQL